MYVTYASMFLRSHITYSTHKLEKMRKAEKLFKYIVILMTLIVTY